MKNITVIGTGYVGLVSGAGLSDFGNLVVCADIDESKISLLKAGKIPIFEPGLKEVVDRNVKSNRLSFTTDVSKAIRDSEVIFIGVGTPEGKNGEADLSAVFSVAETIGNNLNTYKIICTKSTVPIGTGAKIISIINECKNTKHNGIKRFPLEQTHCPSCPIHNSGKNKGQKWELKKRLNDKDVCQLYRGSFIKKI